MTLNYLIWNLQKKNQNQNSNNNNNKKLSYLFIFFDLVQGERCQFCVLFLDYLVFLNTTEQKKKKTKIT